MSHDSIGQALPLLLVPNSLLVTLIGLSSLVCLGMAIGMVYARKNAHDRKIASALANAVRDRVV